MQLAAPPLKFPTRFCCNCGSMDCVVEVQDTRLTRPFGFGGGGGTLFQLPVPVCASCRRTTRRPPPGLLGRLLVVAGIFAVVLLALVVTLPAAEPPSWLRLHRLGVSVALALLVAFVFYRLRRAHPPQTSFYQPVRIRALDVRVHDVMNGAGQVAFMKIAFTNPEYLNLFADANREAIDAGQVAAVKA